MHRFLQTKSSIELVVYSEELKESWEDFIENKAINSSFLHSRRFFEHNPLNAIDDSSLVFYKDRMIVAIFPAVLYRKEETLILHSHLRATYGGFVVSKKVGAEEAIDIVGQTILFAKKNKIGQIVVRNPFRIIHTALCDETDYALWFHGFKIMSRELETAVELDGNTESIWSHYHKGTKYSVGKARKEITITLSEDLEEFWVLLEKCLMERHGQKPVHDYLSICKLREKVGKDKVLLFAAYYKDKLVGGNVVFNFSDRVLHGQYSAFDKNHQYLMPLHATVDYILNWGTARKFKYFNMGTSNEEEGRKLNLGLLRYKESYGARNLLRETMYLDLD